MRGDGRLEASILGGFRTSLAQPPENVDFSPLWKAWRLLEKKYIPATTTEEITPQDRLWGAIEGLAKSYGDPYTVFLPPQEATLFEEDISGEFSGVGMEVGIRDRILTVITPLKDSPAERAGLLAGDRILAIDGKSTKDMSIDEAVRLIRGEKGTEVKLDIARERTEEILEITIVRDTIHIPTSKYYLRDDGVFVIELYNFGATASEEFRKALRAFVRSGTGKLILDLRGNPGGFLESAVEIASWFLPMGKPVVVEKFGGNGAARVHRSLGYNVYRPWWRVAVLVNEGSASASEIVAGALQEHQRATLVGMRTFGKGSVQELVEVTPDTFLKVTVARWLTPKGRSLSEEGLEPDITVEVTPEDLEAGRDPQLEKAVEFLLN